MVSGTGNRPVEVFSQGSDAGSEQNNRLTLGSLGLTHPHSLLPSPSQPRPPPSLTAGARWVIYSHPIRLKDYQAIVLAKGFFRGDSVCASVHVCLCTLSVRVFSI